MKILKLIFSTTIGSVFIISALFKAYAPKGFELEIYSLFSSYLLSSLLSKSIISFEIFLGLLLLFRIDGPQKLIIKSATLFIFILSIYLIPQAFTGSAKNCHCFGELIELSAMESLVKNVLMLSMLVFMWVTSPDPTLNAKYRRWISIGVLMITTSAFGILFLISENEIINYKVNQRPFLNMVALKGKEPFTSLALQNKTIVVFFSATCPHCFTIAKQLMSIQKVNKELRFISFINGDAGDVDNFLRETHLAKNNTFNLNGEDFLKRYGNDGLPAMYLVKNDTAYARVHQLGPYQVETILNWLK